MTGKVTIGILGLFIAPLWGVMGCSDRVATVPETTLAGETAGVDLAIRGRVEPVSKEPVSKESALALINRDLARRGANYRVATAEYLVPERKFVETGQILFASDRYKRLFSRWVPGDSRRNADQDRLTYLVVQADGASPGVSSAETEAAIDAAMETWDMDSECSGVDLIKRPDSGADATVIDHYLELGDLGNPFLADIVNAGFLSREFFDRLVDGGSSFIIAVTFTMVFVDNNDHPTDADGNRYFDIAFKEIYYNSRFPWTVADTPGIDVETVALHENGHALGLGHFGNLFVTTRNQKLHASPRAVMNAAYLGPLPKPRTTDRAAYCGIYSTWPRD